MAEAYRVLGEDGAALRATFVLDREGKVRHALVNDTDLRHSVQETRRTLDALIFTEKTGKGCPANWTMEGL